MGKFKPILITALIALVAVAIATRVSALKNIVFNTGA
jgi:hypothetical protein